MVFVQTIELNQTPKYNLRITQAQIEDKRYEKLFFTFDQPSGTIAMFLLPNDGITAKEQRQLLSQQHK